MAKSTRLKRTLPSLKSKHRNQDITGPESFNQFYGQHHVSVFRYIFWLLGGPSDVVEDLTADTFMRAWKARQSFDGNTDAGLAWVFKIAHRLVIDHHRRRKVRQAVDIADFCDIDSQQETPEEEVLANEQSRILWRLLRSLPPEQKEIIALRYQLDWRVKQIASFLGIKENTVSVRLRRIIKRLRDNWPKSDELLSRRES